MANMERRPDSRGKVRDIYQAGDNLLMVATDRISAFDYILPDEIPFKGEVLNRISAFWFEKFADIVPNHLVSIDPADFPEEFAEYRDYLAGRAMLVRRAETIPVECIVRGYLTGSGKKTYDEDGTVCGIKLPAGLTEASKLPEPIFTPSTKAAIGDLVRSHGRDRGRRDCRADSRSIAEDLHRRLRVCCHARHHHRRYEVRVRCHRRQGYAYRRVPHARLEPFLAGRLL